MFAVVEIFQQKGYYESEETCLTHTESKDQADKVLKQEQEIAAEDLYTYVISKFPTGEKCRYCGRDFEF